MNRDRETLNRLIDIRTRKKPDRRQGAIAYPPLFRRYENKGEVTPTLSVNVMMIPPASDRFTSSSPMPAQGGGTRTYEIDRTETGNAAYIASFPSVQKLP